MNHPPPWCPPVADRGGRGAPFHFFEVLEQHVTWAAYSFLQPRVGFTSAIWLHDGFWVAPGQGRKRLQRFILTSAELSALTRLRHLL